LLIVQQELDDIPFINNAKSVLESLLSPGNFYQATPDMSGTRQVEHQVGVDADQSGNILRPFQVTTKPDTRLAISLDLTVSFTQLNVPTSVTS